MSLLSLNELPPESRLFIFPADRALTQSELEFLHANLQSFLREWTAHRNELSVGYAVEHNQFVIIAVDESKLPPSGCSIDSLVRFLKEVESRLRIELVDGPEVCFWDAGEVRCASRKEFSALAGHGIVTSSTVVFDNTIFHLGDLATNWEVPAEKTWHSKAFELQTA